MRSVVCACLIASFFFTVNAAPINVQIPTNQTLWKNFKNYTVGTISPTKTVILYAYQVYQYLRAPGNNDMTYGTFLSTDVHDSYLWRIEEGTQAQCDGETSCIHIQNADTMKWWSTGYGQGGNSDIMHCNLDAQQPGTGDKYYWHLHCPKCGPNGGDEVNIYRSPDVNPDDHSYVGFNPKKNGQVLAQTRAVSEQNCHDSTWCGPNLWTWEAIPAFTQPTGTWERALTAVPLSNPTDTITFEIDYTTIDTSSHSQTVEESFSYEVKEGFTFNQETETESISNSVTDSVMQTFEATSKQIVEGTCGNHCDGKTQVYIWQFVLTANQNGSNGKQMKVSTMLHQLVKATFPNGPKCVAGCCQDFDCQVCAC